MKKWKQIKNDNIKASKSREFNGCHTAHAKSTVEKAPENYSNTIQIKLAFFGFTIFSNDGQSMNISFFQVIHDV